MNATQVAAHLTPLELFEQADVIVKSILVLLTLASLVSWGVIIDKLLRFARLRRNAITWTAALAGQRSLGRLAQELKQHTQDPFARIYHAIVDEWYTTHRQHLQKEASGRDSLKERINRVGQIASNVEVEQLQRGLSVLATVGSVAPFVGLFGTVWGIFHALGGMAEGGATIDKIAGPVGEALVFTATGLAVAIPAVLAYNVYGKRVAACEAELEGFAHDLREMRLDSAVR